MDERIFNEEESWNDHNEIWFAQSSPLSGTYAPTGLDLRKGILEAFNEINLLGGIFGSKKLKLFSMDDAYEAEQTIRNVNYYLNLNQTFFGFIGFFGSKTTQSVYKTITSLGYPLIGSYTGAQFLRTPFNRNIINVVRPSYYDEVISLLDYLFYKKDARKISIFYQTDIFGSDGYKGVVESLQYFGVKMCSYSPFNVTTNNLNDIEQSVKTIASCNPDSIIIVALTNATQTFLKHVFDSNLFRKDINIAATSINSDTLIKVLGYNISSKIIFNQAVPDPTELTNPLVLSFQKARKVYDINAKGFGTISELEGYLIGKFTYNLLQRTIGNLTRSNFLRELYYSQEILIDRMRIGTFIDCQNSSCINGCNQGSKTFWRDRVSSEGYLKTVDVFTWYSVCTSTPSAIHFPFLVGQLVFKHENYTKINRLLKEGISNGLSLKNIGGNDIHLITIEYENIQQLISNTVELITSYNVIAIAGITGLENLSANDQSKFKNLFIQNFTNTPVVGIISDDPHLMSASGNNFIQGFINLRTGIIEQAASLLEFIFSKGFTRISLVFSKDSNTIFDYFIKLLNVVHLEIESTHTCEDEIIFNSKINPHAIIISCLDVKQIIEKIDNGSNFRNDGVFIILKDAFQSNNFKDLQISRKVLFSSSYMLQNYSSLYISELFSLNTQHATNLREYLNSDISLEGFYIGDFISFVMYGMSDSSTKITGNSFLAYIYSIENVNLHGQVIGPFSNTKYPYCNIGIRQRYIYQIFNGNIVNVYISKFSTEECGLQKIIERPDSSYFSRPFQFVKLIKTSNENIPDSVVVDNEDDFTKGVNAYFSNINEDSSKYYPYSFQVVNQYYNSKTNLEDVIQDLSNNQNMFAFLGPDISETKIASFLIKQSENIPIICPLSSNMIYRKFSNNTINLLPSIIDQTSAMIYYFSSNFASRTIVLLLEPDGYWYETEWLNTLSEILEDELFNIKIEYLNKYLPDNYDILLIFASPNKLIEFYYTFIHNSDSKPFVGIISDIYNTKEISNFLNDINDPSFIYTPVIELLNISSYVTTKFSQIFPNYFSNNTPAKNNQALNGFITALFIDEVFDSFVNLKSKTSSEFLRKVFEISSLEIGDLRFGPFEDCTSNNNTQCESCNQGVRSILISQVTRINNIVQLTNVGRFNFDTCGVVPSTKDLTHHILLLILFLLLALVVLMIILLSTLIIKKIITKTQESQHAPISKGTFAFTDIQNSTLLWQTNERVMKTALYIHNKIMRRNINIFKGYEVKTQGDSFFVAFKSPDNAIHWALKVQSDLMKTKWPSDIMTQYDCRPQFDETTKNMVFSGLRVRIGIHCGQVESVNDKIVKRVDYFGSCINQSARIESIAEGGMVLISEDLFKETEHLFLNNTIDAEKTHPSKYFAEDFGYCSLKGIKESVKVFSISNETTKLRKFDKIGKTLDDISLASLNSTNHNENQLVQSNVADFLNEKVVVLEENC